MKRTLWLGLLAFAAVPLLAQAPPAAGPTGKIHGKVVNPTGAPQTSGTVSLSTDNGRTNKYTFDVDASGSFAGEAAPGTYTLVAWHELYGPSEQTVTVGPKETKNVTFTFKATAAAGD